MQTVVQRSERTRIELESAVGNWKTRVSKMLSELSGH
jgi:hypothetical protein